MVLGGQKRVMVSTMIILLFTKTVNVFYRHLANPRRASSKPAFLSVLLCLIPTLVMQLFFPMTSLSLSLSLTLTVVLSSAFLLSLFLCYSLFLWLSSSLSFPVILSFSPPSLYLHALLLSFSYACSLSSSLSSGWKLCDSSFQHPWVIAEHHWKGDNEIPKEPKMHA